MKKPITNGIFWAFILLLFFSGCMSRDTQKQNDGKDNVNYYLYVANNSYSDKSIFAYKIDMTNGLLNPVPGSPFPFGSDILAADPHGRFLYATDSNKVSGYSIDASSGGLKRINNYNWASIPYSIIVEPNGKYLYSADSYSISQYRILETTGELDPISIVTPAQDPDNYGTFITTDPLGKNVLILNSNNILKYQISDNGTLIKESVTPLAISPDWITFDSMGRFAYVADNISYDGVNGVYTLFKYSFSDNTLLHYTEPVSYPNCMALAPNAPYAYIACNGGSGDIVAFKISDTGDLTLVDTRPGVGNMKGIAIDPTGQYLYTVITGSGQILAFRIKNDGKLEQLGGTFPAGSIPSSIVIVGAAPQKSHIQ